MISSISNIIYIFSCISNKNKKRALFQILLSIFVSQIEILNIFFIAKFLDLIQSNNYYSEIIFFQNLNIFQLGFICLIVILFTMFLNVFNIFCSSKLAALLGTEITLKTFNRQISSDWIIQSETSSAEKIANINNTGSILSNVFTPLFESISSLLSSLAILFSIVWFGGSYSLSIIIFMLVAYFFISIIFAKRLKTINKRLVLLNNGQFSIMNDAYNSTRFNSTSEITNNHFSNFKKVMTELRGYSADINFIVSSPKSILEGIGIALAIGLTLILFRYENEKAFTILGILAIGVQRLLPRANSLYQAFARIKSNISITNKLTEVLKLKKDPALDLIKNNLKKKSVLKTKKLTIKNLSYKFGEDLILNYPDNSFSKGEYLGLIGKSGSGKSTLLDLLSGLREPFKGTISLDNKSIWDDVRLRASWRDSIGIAEQDPFIFEKSIFFNITFLTENHLNDDELYKLKKCLEVSRVEDFCNFNSLLKEYKTNVKEYGGNLSGGMKQRIGLCRALFQAKSWLIIDEATSFLDMSTESLIIDGLKNEFRDLGIIASAHRKSMIDSFDRCIEI